MKSLFQGLFIGLLILQSYSVWSAESNILPLDQRLTSVNYPYPISHFKLTIQGQSLEMTYMDVRPEKKLSNGEAVVLFHGKNFSSSYWAKTAESLLASGYRVIMPDQIGFGKSSKSTTLQFSFQLLANNTKLLLDSLEITSVHVLGHSMGGMLATRYALMYGSQVKTLTLENPIGLEDWKRWVPYQTVDQWHQGELKKTPAKIKQYQLKSYYDNKWKSEYTPWYEQLAGWTISDDYPHLAKQSAVIYDMIFTQPVFYEFEQLDMPVLLIIGQRDRTALGKAYVTKERAREMGNYPQLGRAVNQRIPNSKLIEMEGIGHLPHIENFDQFIDEVTSFLKLNPKN